MKNGCIVFARGTFFRKCCNVCLGTFIIQHERFKVSFFLCKITNLLTYSTKDKPIIFAFHGYPTLIHELTYERNNHNISVHGYQEEGTITTPFDMRVQNQIDRFNLVKDAIMHLPQLGNKGSFLIQKMNDKLVEHKQYIAEYGQDLEEIRNWEWHK